MRPLELSKDEPIRRSHYDQWLEEANAVSWLWRYCPPVKFLITEARLTRTWHELRQHLCERNEMDWGDLTEAEASAKQRLVKVLSDEIWGRRARFHPDDNAEVMFWDRLDGLTEVSIVVDLEEEFNLPKDYFDSDHWWGMTMKELTIELAAHKSKMEKDHDRS
jgi:hypothetical protein